MYQVFVDSGANIPAVVVKKYGIRVISFVVQCDGEDVVCFDPDLTEAGEQEKGHVYYDKMRHGMNVKTALVNSDDFTAAFSQVLSAGEDVLYISLSSNISGTYNSARIAAEGLREEYPDRKICLVDSLNASLAQGILAIYAVQLREKGYDVERVADMLSRSALGMNGVFTVGDLKHLMRTGRVKTLTGLAGNLLNIKPILRGNAKGFIVEFRKCRGRKRALDNLIDLVCENIVAPEKQIVGIAHADALEDANYVIEGIRRRVNVKEFLYTMYDFCTGSHVGPDTIALFFMAPDRELSGRAGVAPEVLTCL